MRYLYPGFYEGRAGAALLFQRLVFGLAYILHGLPLTANVPGFAAMLKVPQWLAAIGAWTEVIGGALVIAGLLTPLAALALLGQVVAALALVHLPHGDPFVAGPGKSSYELAVLFGATMLALLLMGPGVYSLAALIMRARGERTATSPQRSRGTV